MKRTRTLYAEDTKVPVAESQAAIERLVTDAGATEFYRGNDSKAWVIGFVLKDRRIAFELAIPTAATVPRKRGSTGSVEALIEKTAKARWRALFLTVKAKLISVESGIEVFEEAFLGQIVVPNSGKAERFAPIAIAAIAKAYVKGGTLPSLLPANPGRPEKDVTP